MLRLLVINPNTTASITDLALRYVRAAVGEGVELVGTTGRFGCAYISSEACYAVAAHAALDCYAEHGEGCDGVLLACFGDPGLFALREVSKVPVTGLAEASMLAASRARRAVLDRHRRGALEADAGAVRGASSATPAGWPACAPSR